MQKLRGSAFLPVVRLVLRPVGELTGAEAAHAVDLVGADFERLRRRDKDERRVRGAEGSVNPARPSLR
jgi:hypothetical protein